MTEPSDVNDAAREAARRKLGDCDERLDRYRTALEGGTDPAVVTGWIAEVQGERLAAERVLAATKPTVVTGAEVPRSSRGSTTWPTFSPRPTRRRKRTSTPS